MSDLQILQWPRLQTGVAGLQLRERGARGVLVVKEGVIKVAEQDGHRIIMATRRK